MSEMDSKPKFGGNGNKSRFGSGAAIRYGGGFRQNQLKEKCPTTGLEHIFCDEQIECQMAMFRKGTDVLATYVRSAF